jgi:hypothetical protein
MIKDSRRIDMLYRPDVYDRMRYRQGRIQRGGAIAHALRPLAQHLE